MISLDRILCPVDLSESSQLAMGHAATLAAWYESRLTVLHVFSNLPVFDVAPALGTSMPPVLPRVTDRETVVEAVNTFVAPVTAHAKVDVEVIEAVDPRREILERAKTLPADLLVMGTHGRSGFDHLLLGSVTEKLIRKSPCPVLVVPPHAAAAAAAATPPFKRIVCAIDFSDVSLRALTYALDLALEADASIKLVHVIEMPPELGEFPFSADFNVNGVRAAAEAEYLQRLRALIPENARDYCTVTTEVSEGRAHREILRIAAAEHADVIVIGVQGRGAVDLVLFGSNSHAVIRGAACPVLVVPGA